MFEITGTWRGSSATVTWDDGDFDGPPDFLDAINYMAVNVVEGPHPLVFDNPDLNDPEAAAQVIEFIFDEVTHTTGPIVDWEDCFHDPGIDLLVKHYGPGPHANGTPQTIHNPHEGSVAPTSEHRPRYWPEHYTTGGDFTYEEFEGERDKAIEASGITEIDARGWKESLSPKQLAAWEKYISLNEDNSVNEALRAGKSSAMGKVLQDSMMESPVPLTLYQGVNEDYVSVDGLPDLIGQEVVDEGLAFATSFLPDATAYSGGVIMRLHIPAGTKVAPIYQAEMQGTLSNEVGLSSGLAYRFTEASDVLWPEKYKEITPGFTGYHIVDVEVYDPTVTKHYGPGAHPGTGTSQEAHAGRITVGRGEGTLNKAPVAKYLVDAKGNELLNSFKTLGKAHILVNGKVQPAEDIRQKIMDTIKGAGEKTTDLERNLQMVMDSALARYADDPTLIDKDRFYQMWHEVLSDIATKHNLPLDDVIAASALISPGLKAYHNILYANDLATWIAEDVGWSGGDAKAIRDRLKDVADKIHHPVWQEGQAGVQAGLHKIGDPKDPPKEGSFRWLQGQTIYDDLEKIGTGSFKVSDLSDYSAAFALSAHRARVGGLNIEGLPEALVGKYKFPKAGFSAKNTGFFASAIGVLRGTTTPDEALGDVKTRSFFNNILDPDASGKFGDVTVDYHMADAAFMSNRFGKDNTREQDLVASPAIEGVGVGVRPLVADHVRTVAARTTVAGEQLTPLRAQEILWAEWARGMSGTGKEKITHWVDYSTGKRWKLGA